MNTTINIANKNYTATPKYVTSSNGTKHLYYVMKITVGHNPVTGKQIQKTFSAKSPKELEAKIKAELHCDHHLTDNNVSVKDWLLSWFESYRHALKTGTQACYRSKLEHTIIPYLGNIKLADINTFHIQHMINDLVSKNMNPGTIKAILNTLKLGLEPAVHQRILLYNPCVDVRTPQTPHFEVLPFSDNDISNFFDVIEQSEYSNLFAVLLLSGLRIGEALGLSWKDVDFERNSLKIHQQLVCAPKSDLHKWETYIQPSTKTRQVRVIYPPKLCFDYLKREALRQNKFKEMFGNTWSNADDLVFTAPDGSYLCHRIVRKTYKVYAAKINRPETRLHDLRHTAASLTMALSGDIRMVQHLLGHSSMAMAMWYTHTTETAMANLSEKIDAFYNNLHIAVNE